MPRNWTRLLWVTAVLLIISANFSPAGVVGEHLLPSTTKGVILVTDAKNLSDTWQKTQLGQLMSDPVMKPFSEDIRRQFGDRNERPSQETIDVLFACVECSFSATLPRITEFRGSSA